MKVITNQFHPSMIAGVGNIKVTEVNLDDRLAEYSTAELMFKGSNITLELFADELGLNYSQLLNKGFKPLMREGDQILVGIADTKPTQKTFETVPVRWYEILNS